MIKVISKNPFPAAADCTRSAGMNGEHVSPAHSVAHLMHDMKIAVFHCVQSPYPLGYSSFQFLVQQLRSASLLLSLRASVCELSQIIPGLRLFARFRINFELLKVTLIISSYDLEGYVREAMSNEQL